MWIGWLGFNGGSTLKASDTVPLIVTNTIVGGVFGIVASLLLTRIRFGKPKALDILNGSLGGLVAITAGCDAVDIYFSTSIESTYIMTARRSLSSIFPSKALMPRSIPFLYSAGLFSAVFNTRFAPLFGVVVFVFFLF